MKWLTDYIYDYGIDGYRVDTVKHTEEYVWQEFRTECDYAFSKWKYDNQSEVLDNNAFYLVGEVYNYGINSGQVFDFGDKKVNYFKNGFSSLINFDFKSHAKQRYEKVFKKYASVLEKEFKNYSVLNYLSSHDDASPYDPNRKKSIETATKLLLSPGASQIYYGDEMARPLVVEGSIGDANLRSAMNWNDMETNKEILAHWQKLGQFRKNHPAIGAGLHQMITQSPYTFYRSYYYQGKNDLVAIGLNMNKGEKTIDVSKLFKDGEMLRDAYSGKTVKVLNGKATINSNYNIVLLEITSM